MRYAGIIGLKATVSFTFAALLVGCAGQSARTVAFSTLQTAAQYEKELDRKISAEKRFYKQQATNLNAKLSGFPPLVPCRSSTAGGVTELADADAASNDLLRLCKVTDQGEVAQVDDDDIKKGWLYGRIYSSTLRDGRMTASELLSKGKDSETIALIMEFVERGILDSQAAIVEVREKQAMLAQSVAKKLAPIGKQKQRLAALRKGLTALATEPDDASKMQQIGTIAAVIVEEIKKSNAAGQPAANQ